MPSTDRPCAAIRLLTALACAVLLGGCASSPKGGAYDPWEPVNRPVYRFNDVFDRNIARPVARGYKTVTPGLVRQGVGNFFSNLDDVPVLVNSVLQLKGRKAARTTFRLLFNSVIGLYGIIDVAGAVGVEKQNEDLGQTLGHWGLGPGPYVVLPFLGPSSLRDTGGRIGDAQYGVLDEIAEEDSEYYGAILLNAVDSRARLLGASRVLDTAAIDPYSFMRDAYLKRRANLVHDGNPPPEALPGEPGTAPGQQDEDEEAFDPFSSEDDDLFEDDGTGDDAAGE